MKLSNHLIISIFLQIILECLLYLIQKILYICVLNNIFSSICNYYQFEKQFQCLRSHSHPLLIKSNLLFPNQLYVNDLLISCANFFPLQTNPNPSLYFITNFLFKQSAKKCNKTKRCCNFQLYLIAYRNLCLFMLRHIYSITMGVETGGEAPPPQTKIRWGPNILLTPRPGVKKVKNRIFYHTLKQKHCKSVQKLNKLTKGIQTNQTQFQQALLFIILHKSFRDYVCYQTESQYTFRNFHYINNLAFQSNKIINKQIAPPTPLFGNLQKIDAYVNNVCIFVQT
eukprot:TRINITY_DN176_c2_g2_i1.p1 TRINITY_DN176_c2_g2~~TRINITY_DN176_c2_g2_i1.p1  ORF type:complete len:283 (+),score=-26.43 TRINITY_DN176_c2_g2_i1:229-1077(+)